jgi:hypothetical protein
LRIYVREAILTEAAVKSEVVFEGLSTNRGQVDPDLAVIVVVDHISKVDLIGELEDTICLGRDLDGDTGVDKGTMAPWLSVLTTRLDGDVVGVG